MAMAWVKIPAVILDGRIWADKVNSNLISETYSFSFIFTLTVSVSEASIVGSDQDMQSGKFPEIIWSKTILPESFGPKLSG